ncbi:MAG: rubrerythrin family protein [Candidatus Thorarchaeota archaeon]|nr:rubrerythrin family protein [Candidatus Thorarchaeota archaeon]
MNLRGTQTEKNLLISFAGESQARNRYTYYASIARDEGYIQIMQVFQETADQEKEHAKRFFKMLKEGGATPELEVGYKFPTGPMGTTEENLRAAAAGEKHEFSTMYPGFAAVAEKEGFPKIAALWRMVAKAETWHHERYVMLAENIAKGRVFKRENKVKWRCINCGYVHEGEAPPERCPACDHPKSYFMIHDANY